MLIALTRAVPPSIAQCELTHLSRAPIDLARALHQHRQYEKALAALGCAVQRLPPAPELPDSVFVEDTAVVLPEIAVVTRPGAESRREEVGHVAAALSAYRELVTIQSPGTLDGGDVLCIGTRVYVGQSERSNDEGIGQLREVLSPHGYEVQAVRTTGCLHLKTAVTCVASGTVLLNPSWVDTRAFDEFDQIEVHPDEPFAANALRVGDAVLYPARHVATRRKLEARGLEVLTIATDELEKAEGGVTCCSILVPTGGVAPHGPCIDSALLP
jgi:dimethylargininase